MIPSFVDYVPFWISEHHTANKSTSEQQHKKKAIQKNTIEKDWKEKKNCDAKVVQPCQLVARSLVPLLAWQWELGARKNLLFDEFASLFHAFLVLEVHMTKQCLN